MYRYEVFISGAQDRGDVSGILGIQTAEEAAVLLEPTCSSTRFHPVGSELVLGEHVTPVGLKWRILPSWHVRNAGLSKHRYTAWPWRLLSNSGPG